MTVQLDCQLFQDIRFGLDYLLLFADTFGSTNYKKEFR